MKKEKELIPIDENTVCGTIGYGYSSKRKFIKDLEETTGEKISREARKNIEKARVQKITFKGEEFYIWKNTCPRCGVWSFLDLD